MNIIFDLSWTRERRVRIISYWLLIAIILLSMYGVSNKSAYADGSVPPNATEAYPGLDPRLVGVPIIKTDTSAALVAYSEAVAKVSNLESERVTLQNRISVLTPEQVRAQTIADARNQEFQTISSALNELILSQYQNIDSGGEPVDDTTGIDELRLTHQSSKAIGVLRVSKEKAAERKKDADNYLELVKTTLETSKQRTDSIGSEISTAKQAVIDKRDVVRSGIPVALIEGLEIPVLTMDAYLRAEKVLAAKKPECGIPWWALAGIGRAESNHGRFRGAILDQNGTVSPPIIGVPLNGNGFAAIGDSDGGALDGDKEWDRAVGVMQFIPGTWKGYGEDGNGDGVIDPQNVYDAAMAAGNLLCANARPNMTTEEGRRTAYLRYNNSKSYADFVETKGREYEAIGAGRFNPAPAEIPTDPAQ